MLIQRAGVNKLLSDEDIEEYRTIARKRSGKELTKQQAYEDANKLIRFMQLICKPIENLVEDEYIDTKKKGNEKEK